MQLHITLPEPAYLYVYWLDGQGKLKRMWPLEPDDQQPLTELYDPPQAATATEQEWHVLGGNPGTELILAASSPTPLSAADMKTMETLKVRFGTPVRSLDRNLTWLPATPSQNLKIVRPEHTKVPTREPVSRLKSTKGNRTVPKPFEEHLQVFGDFYVLLAPRK